MLDVEQIEHDLEPFGVEALRQRAAWVNEIVDTTQVDQHHVALRDERLDQGQVARARNMHDRLAETVRQRVPVHGRR